MAKGVPISAASSVEVPLATAATRACSRVARASRVRVIGWSGIVGHEGRHPGRVQRRSDRHYVNVIRTQKLRGFEQNGQDARDFAAAAAGQQCDPWAARFDLVFAGKLGAGNARSRQVRQRMAHELRVDSSLAIELLFEREDHQHLAHIFSDPFDAALLPGPELRADVINHRDIQFVEFARQPQVEVGKVDEDSGVRTAIAGFADYLAKATIDVGNVLDHLDDADLGDLAGVGQELASSLAHAVAAYAEKLYVGLIARIGRVAGVAPA